MAPSSANSGTIPQRNQFPRLHSSSNAELFALRDPFHDSAGSPKSVAMQVSSLFSGFTSRHRARGLVGEWRAPGSIQSVAEADPPAGVTHTHLCQKVLRSPPALVKSSRRLDAVIVPATRPASALQPTIDLAAWLDVPLVVLCSKQTKIEHVVQRVSRTPRAKTIVVSIPDEWEHPMFPVRTSAKSFRIANANRASDLSAKRNIGLLLARLHGWNKIVFLDDDIRLPTSRSIARLTAQLDMHQVAGMLVREHPDNSVVCHARRLAGLQQDVFVTGELKACTPCSANKTRACHSTSNSTQEQARIGHDSLMPVMR
jgi:hypothetical protein